MRLALALIIALTTTPAAAQDADPRAVVASVAERIRDLYFDANRGDEIANGLEAASKSGAFDQLTDPRDLAAALTTRLKPLDAHFNVVFDPNAPSGPGPAGQPAMRPPAGPNPMERASHFGFRRAEILPGNVGYIELRQFSDINFENPDDPARQAADAALNFVDDADAVIFDLRDNGGGAPSMVGYLSSAFTPADANIYNVFHNRQGVRHEAPAVFHPSPRLDVPVYILISARSGSAAEAFPYTLQSAGRAVIIGERSGGAANPGGMVPAGDGFSIFVSSGSPINPITGTNWEGVGVEPDIPVPSADALARAHAEALRAILSSDPMRRDAEWALQALQPTPVVDLTDFAGVYSDRTVVVVQDTLHVLAGRRPPVVLAPLGDDLFTVVGDPSRRYQFSRDGAGRVIAFDAVSLGGPGQRARRTD